jgi:hypothetical protein
MANQSLLTNYGKLSEVEQIYYSPVVELPDVPGVPFSSVYCFLSKVDPWPDDNAPPAPSQTQAAIKQTFKNIFVAKRVQTNDLSPVIERFDWTDGVVYDYYRDDVDMFEVDGDNKLVRKFYIKNQYDQVFKCLWNGNGSPSTSEPYFEPGNYGVNNIYYGADGYKWKFMYNVDIGTAQKFMDSNWLPCPVGANTPDPSLELTTAGAGSIDVINILDGGSGYDPANAIITLTITGDGAGANAVANVVNGSIDDIVVNNAGGNYTYANVAIVSNLGSGVSVIAPTSPVGGHGYDPVSELGASRIMFVTEFDGSEGGVIPTDITFYQVGLVVNPTSLSMQHYPANATIYRTTTDLVVAPGFGEYVSDEIVWQGDTLETASFFGTICSFDVASNTVKLINTTGTPILNAPLFGKNSSTTRTLLSYNQPDFVILSGYMSYIENRSGVTRSPDGIEQVKIVLGY